MIYTFKDDENHILLDVESSSLHLVDELVFDVCNCMNKGISKERIIALLKVKYNQEEIIEALDELEELEKGGMFNAPSNENISMQDTGVIKAMCLNVAHDCNLRCNYCFADTGEYKLGKALMPLSVGKRALDFLVAHSKNRKNLEVDFFGGEPLLNFEVVKSLVEYGRKLEKEFDKTIAFTMTTNALALNDEIIDFCNKELSNVVISIDGRAEVHDRVRKTANGKGSFAYIIENAKKMAFARQEMGKDYYIRGTYTKNNLDFYNDIMFLADMGLEQISIEPVVLPEDDPIAITENDLPVINEQYTKLAKEYFARRNEQDKWFSFFHFNIDIENGPCAAKRVSGCGAGDEYIAITPQGDIYPCHQFIGREEFIMGNVITSEFNESIRQKFKSCNITTKKDCKSCWAKYFCSGGCIANAHSFNGDIHKPYSFSCKLEKDRLKHAISLFIKEKQLQNEV